MHVAQFAANPLKQNHKNTANWRFAFCQPRREVRLGSSSLPDAKRLREVLTYFPDTGKLYWRARDAAEFSKPQYANAWNARFAGREAFTAVNNCGYRKGAVDGVQFSAHQVIWALTGLRASEAIDHINGRRQDNRLCNLRACTASMNLRNSKKRANNSSGVNGVYWSKGASRWVAQCRTPEVNTSKTFTRLDEAIKWRRTWERRLGFTRRHGFNPNTSAANG